MLRFKLAHKNGLDQMRPDTLKPVRDKVIIFATIGQEFTPKDFRGKLHLFRAGGRTREFGRDLTLGWDGIVKGGIELHNVPGGHVGILEKPFVQTLVDQLKRYLVGNGKRN
jgi:thioesterase domain-containing protein